MQLYLAPLEGVTDVTFRRTHHQCFGGVDKVFLPFVSPTQHMVFTNRELRALDPVANASMHAVPQILTRNPDHFLWMATQLQQIGYQEINLNLGCPSATVTAKGKGAGLLRDRDALCTLLDGIYGHSPIAVSIKTRIGYESPQEWPMLFELFRQYPISELIVHARTRMEFYKGTPHAQCCELALTGNADVVYNGDLFTPEDCARVQAQYPGLSALMLGRGLIANPALARQIKGGAPLTSAALRDFHDRLYAEYQQIWQKNTVIGHMQEIMSYLLCAFSGTDKVRKALRKAKNQQAYEDAIARLFGECELKPIPAYERPESGAGMR